MPKLGYITGSRAKDLMTQGRGKALWGKTSEKLAIRIAAERLGLLELKLDGYTSDSMEWGVDQEDAAILEYERTTFTEVHGKQSFQQHPELEWVGCTPDGLVGEDGMIEVKNPDSENHILHMINGDQLKQYKDQVQGSLWVTGRKWCDFVSHDSRIQDRPLRIHITRVKRDEDYIADMHDRYLEFEKIVSRYTEQLNELNRNNKSLKHVA